MSAIIKCCIDYPIAAGLPSYAALATAKKWPNGTVLRVRFLGGNLDQHQAVELYASQWGEHANIRFAFGDDPNAQIRVSFFASGSWSAVGIDALDVPDDHPTMNFGWLLPDVPANEARSVVLHEFGHSLGLIHEHENPAGSIPWNKPAIYDALGGPPNNWDPATIEHNMFATYDKNQTQYTELDRSSIMIYPIPPEWVTDPAYVVGLNDTLSDRDKQFIARMYPR
jgi:hypothetical protein